MTIISFVAASSGSGKTTLIEKIVPILKSRGLRVAVIKHASAGFDVDMPGKDSWRFQQAGADTVILASSGQVAVMKTIDRESTQDDLAWWADDADVVLTEGFKKNALNRIEVFRTGVSGDRPLCLDDRSFLALVSDRPFPIDIPRFDIDDAAGVAEFVMSRVR